VLTVSADRDQVERQLGVSGLFCPDCGGALAGWGRARPRQIRGPDRGVSRLTPRRARCRDCRRTHVLLPVTCLARRADAAEVIGVALEAKAAGAGHRTIASVLGRPASTVRGWLRAFSVRAEVVRQAFTALAAGLITDPPLPGPAGSAMGDAVAAVTAAAGRPVIWAGLVAFVGPLIARLTLGRRDPYVRRHAGAALRFNASLALYLALIIGGLRLTAGSPYTIQLVPFLLFVNMLLAFNWLVFTAIAMHRASAGQTFTYPLTLRRPRGAA
jgi:uncharacterized Tic20 family protein